MAKSAKGVTRYLFFRGKDENGDDIVLDMFNKKELDLAIKEGRVEEEDRVVKIELLERVDLKKPKPRKQKKKK